MIPLDEFPRLTDTNHRVTSPESKIYNCIAWAAGDTANWWQPNVYWPVPVDPEAAGSSVLEQVFASLGYAACADADFSAGVEKVALYASGKLYTHAARQLPSGKWTSKLGKGEDIEHDTPADVGGVLYGEALVFMMRPTA